MISRFQDIFTFFAILLSSFFHFLLLILLLIDTLFCTINESDTGTQFIRVYFLQWGFHFEDIKIPIHIWHGEADTLAPIDEVKKTVRRLPYCSTHFVPNAGHFLTEDPDIWSSILQTLKKSFPV
jgi:pimeloyl-ACP methyl ester carboxylesterase